MADPAVSEGGDDIVEGEDEVQKIRNDYDNLQAAHAALLERIHQDGDRQTEDEVVQNEFRTLRARIKELEQSLSQVTTERDELSSTVRDLRVRVEESRRAIMRLQGQGGVVSGSSGAETMGVSASTSANQKQDNRRSVGPAVLASWNPREMGTGLGVTTTAPSPQLEGGNQTQTAEELAEQKKSKRASLAFGPYAQGSMARRMHGHRRIASGSRIGAEDGDAQAMPPPSAGGLRELHLGGATVGPSAGSSSKRTSVIGGSAFRSPASETIDLPPEDSPEKQQGGLAATVGSLLMPSRAVRRTSNSSSVSGGQPNRDESESSLAPPRSMSRMSQSPSQVSIASPILEDTDGDHEEEPLTARAGGSLFGMQQGSMPPHQMQRSLVESKGKLRDRDDQIIQLKREMSMLRMQLDEAKDARAASEACLTALREFVKMEGQGAELDGTGIDALKGVKLPPLPTDKDAEDLEGSKDAPLHRASISNAPSAWRSIGSTLSGLSRKPLEASENTPGSAKALPPMPEQQQTTVAPQSPASQVTSSFGNLWSRATAGTRESVSASSASPSEGTSAAAEVVPDSRHSSFVSQPEQAGMANTAANSSPTAGFKGFGWFGKRTVSTASDAASSNSAGGTGAGSEPPTPSGLRVSSPPFANLDNHVLTLDQLTSPPAGRTASYASLTGVPGPRKTSLTGSTGGSVSAVNGTGGEIEPNGRVKKAMEMSGTVDEDSGFVPPSF